MSKTNIVMIMTDDHAWQCISAYCKGIVAPTPHIDEIATNGARLDACCCHNSICAPSRANIITGDYSIRNGVRFLEDSIDNQKQMVSEVFQAEGYQTALIGKWHLGHETANTPKGFDRWEIVINQGEYYNPRFQSEQGIHQEKGYATDLISEKSLDFIRNRDKERPFFLLSWHKAPHRPWVPSKKYENYFEDIVFPHPANYDDDYEGRSPAAKAAKMRIEQMTQRDYKYEMPVFSTLQDKKDWIYQRYMRDYSAVLKSVDDAVGEMLRCLKEEGIYEDTVLIYTSDQGFYTGEHGWFDKRFIYEESIRMPFLVQYPAKIKAGQVVEAQVSNIDFAATLLDFCDIPVKRFDCDGKSFLDVLELKDGESWSEINRTARIPAEGRDVIYYHYMDYPSEHNVYPHVGLRTPKYTFAAFYLLKENEAPKIWWELFDRETDPLQLKNLVEEEAYANQVRLLRNRLREEIAASGDEVPIYDYI